MNVNERVIKKMCEVVNKPISLMNVEWQRGRVQIDPCTVVSSLDCCAVSQDILSLDFSFLFNGSFVYC